MIRGYHLMADGEAISCHPGDMDRFLREAVRLTGLTVIMGPVVDEAHGVGMVVIAESHVSVHVRGDRAFVDCFSCRRFNWGAVVGLARRSFGGIWRSRYFARSAEGAALGAATPAGGFFARTLRRAARWWCAE